MPVYSTLTHKNKSLMWPRQYLFWMWGEMPAHARCLQPQHHAKTWKITRSFNWVNTHTTPLSVYCTDPNPVLSHLFLSGVRVCWRVCMCVCVCVCVFQALPVLHTQLRQEVHSVHKDPSVWFFLVVCVYLSFSCVCYRLAVSATHTHRTSLTVCWSDFV